MKNPTIGLIGAGLMGKPMGMNWLNKGFPVHALVHKKPIQELITAGAVECRSLRDICENSKYLILMLPSSREVEETCAVLQRHLAPEQMIIDMSTSDPQSTRQIHERMSKAKLRFMDSPVTGGVWGAQAGELSLFVGGPQEWLTEILPVLKAISKTQTHFGPAGSGHLAKLINNYVCIANMAVLAEALPLASASGLDPQKIFDVLTQGTANSKMLEAYGPQIMRGDFEPRFRISHALKDILLAEKLADGLPVLSGVISLFKKYQELGLPEKNVSALVLAVEKLLNVEFRKNV